MNPDVNLVQPSETRKLTTSVKINKRRKYILLVFSALMLSFSVRYFILAAGLFSGGLGGFSQGLTYTIWALTGAKNGSGTAIGLTQTQFINTIYYVIFIGLNIPIIYYTNKRFGKRFLYDSLIVLFLGTIFTMFFTYTPGFSDASYIILPGMGSGSTPPSLDPLYATLNYFYIVIFALIGGLIYGTAYGTIFAVGACSMGFDPIIRNISKTKGIDVGRLFFISAFINAIFWTIILASINGSITSWASFLQNTIFSPIIVGTILFLGLSSAVANRIYPASRKYLVEVNSSETGKVSDYFNSIHYHRSHSLQTSIGGYSKKERGIFKIIINAEELTDVVDDIKIIDLQALIYVTELKKVYSIHNWNAETKEDKTIKAERLKRQKAKTEPIKIPEAKVKK